MGGREANSLAAIVFNDANDADGGDCGDGDDGECCDEDLADCTKDSTRMWPARGELGLAPEAVD